MGKEITCDPITNICVSPPTVSCLPPLLWSGTACVCQGGGSPIGYTGAAAICPPPPPPAPPPPVRCEMSISFPVSDAQQPELTSVNSGCEPETAAIALAILIARLLSSPR